PEPTPEHDLYLARPPAARPRMALFEGNHATTPCRGEDMVPGVKIQAATINQVLGRIARTAANVCVDRRFACEFPGGRAAQLRHSKARAPPGAHRQSIIERRGACS